MRLHIILTQHLSAASISNYNTSKITSKNFPSPSCYSHQTFIPPHYPKNLPGRRRITAAISTYTTRLKRQLTSPITCARAPASSITRLSSQRKPRNSSLYFISLSLRLQLFTSPRRDRPSVHAARRNFQARDKFSRARCSLTPISAIGMYLLRLAKKKSASPRADGE